MKFRGLLIFATEEKVQTILHLWA